LSERFVNEVYSFLDLPATPPQLRTLSIQQRLEGLNYKGDKNDEGQIRAYLLGYFSRIHLGLKWFHEKDAEEEEFEDLPTLKSAIIVARAKVPQYRSSPMMKLAIQVNVDVPRDLDTAMKDLEKEFAEMKVKDVLGAKPEELLVRNIDELTEKMTGLSITGSTIERWEKDLGVTPENIDSIPKEDLLESMRKAIEDLKITPQDQHEIVGEAAKQLHSQVVEKIDEAGQCGKCFTESVHEFDFLFPSFSKTFFIFLFTLKGSCPRNRKYKHQRFRSVIYE